MKKRLLAIVLSLALFAGVFALWSSSSYASELVQWKLEDGTELQTGVIYPAGTVLKVFGSHTTCMVKIDGATVGSANSTTHSYTVNVPFYYISQTGSPGRDITLESAPDLNKTYNIPIEDSLESFPLGEPATSYINEGTALSNRMMKALLNNPDLSVEFTFEYENVKHTVVIPAGQAVDDDIPWYGPLWLLKKYGEKGELKTYTVKRGDTLNKIAEALGTTVEYLVEKNGIKNKNKIRTGQELVY